MDETSESVAERVEQELREYAYQHPADGSLGMPWSQEKVCARIAKLRLSVNRR
jgi:hypothetical protein